jgi:hypothetical protein
MKGFATFGKEPGASLYECSALLPVCCKLYSYLKCYAKFGSYKSRVCAEYGLDVRERCTTRLSYRKGTGNSLKKKVCNMKTRQKSVEICTINSRLTRMYNQTSVQTAVNTLHKFNNRSSVAKEWMILRG